MNELVLVVDDEPKIVKLARDYLEQGGFRVAVAGTGREALAAVSKSKPDFVVLDLRLPDMDGFDVCREMRKASNVPIIMLTARVEEADRLIGLELGADDYITKPFSPRELVARIRAVLRRVSGEGQHREFIRSGALEIDVRGHSVTRDQEAVHLTPLEFDLLVLLAGRPGQTFTRAQLLDHLSGVGEGAFDRSIDSHVKNLRHKIEPDPARPRLLITEPGVGYRLKDA